jgi:adenylate cyclase
MSERRLAAILAADVAGYSRLMEADEEGTHGFLKSVLREIIEPGIESHHGTLIKTTGDGALVEFPSAVDAVRCAMAVQHDVAERNAARPAEKRAQLRIGVNLGDIIADEGDIFGDAVNVASRIEGLAEPGGICVSGAVYDHVQGKVEAGFEDIGPQSVKNISRPIQVLRVREKNKAEDPASDVSAPVPGFQGRPAIAVLPLQNMSGDPEQEFFADGIAEDILTRLAMWRWCPIIARNSSFAYKGKNVDVRQIGRELGARYVLEGSVRKAGDRVRVTAQLTEAETGTHVWAERYDRKLDDIFALQDEIVDSITAALEPAVGRAEIERARARPPASLDAWELYHRGVWHFLRASPDELVEARKMFVQAVARDPTFAAPHSMLAIMSIFDITFARTKDADRSLREAFAEAQTAIALDPVEPYALAVEAMGYNFRGEYDRALATAQRAIEVNPSFMIGYQVQAITLTWIGRWQDGVDTMLRAIRLSPNDVIRPFNYAGLGLAYYTGGDYDKAVEALRESVRLQPQNVVGQRIFAAALGQAGKRDEARAALDRSLALSSGLSTEELRRALPYRDAANFEHFAQGLRKAGWQG